MVVTIFNLQAGTNLVLLAISIQDYQLMVVKAVNSLHTIANASFKESLRLYTDKIEM